MSARLVELTVYIIAIQLRSSFGHAAMRRKESHNILVRARLGDGTLGWGESLPRPYVSGEDCESTVSAIRKYFAPQLGELEVDSFAELLNACDELPEQDERGGSLGSARAAVELAILDAFGRHFKRPVTMLADWLGYPDFGVRPGLPDVRYSGVLSGDDPAKVEKKIKLMRCFGLREFKLKVGLEHDQENLKVVQRLLGTAVEAGDCTLRADANGSWSAAQAIEQIERLEQAGFRCIEQPLPKGQEDELPLLAAAAPLPIMLDESLVSLQDAEACITQQRAQLWNLRLSKNGGLVPTMRLAELAREHGIGYQLGCMVGETSVLSAAGRHFLTMVSGISHAEGSFGKFLLRSDVTRKPLRFGYGGKAKPLIGDGTAVNVEQTRVEKMATDLPVVVKLADGGTGDVFRA